MVGVVVLLSVCDVTMLQLLPWRRSYFYDESKGFPTFSLMKFCLGIDAVATVGSVTTQILFLNNTSNVNNPATSDLAKAVFALNIAFSIMGGILGLMFMYLKGELLRSADKKDGGGSSSSSSSSGDASDDGSVGDAEAPTVSLDHATTENPLSLAESGGLSLPKRRLRASSILATKARLLGRVVFTSLWTTHSTDTGGAAPRPLSRKCRQLARSPPEIPWGSTRTTDGPIAAGGTDRHHHPLDRVPRSAESATTTTTTT